MTPLRRTAAILFCAVPALGACSDGGATELTAAAANGTSTTSPSASLSTLAPTTTVEATTTVAPPAVVDTTIPGPKPTKAPVPPATDPPETVPPTTVPIPVEEPTDFTLELDGTATDCGVVESPCWNIKASWRGGEWWYNVTPWAFGPPPTPRITTLPLGPTFYPQDGNGKYYLHFLMRAEASDCAGLRAMEPVPSAGSDRSERVQACIDTPAISG